MTAQRQIPLQKENRTARKGTVSAVVQLYCGLFDQVTHQYWTRLLPAEAMIEALRECCQRIGHSTEPLETNKNFIEEAFSSYDEQTFSYLDYIRMLKPLLSPLPHTLISFPARAALAHMHRHIGNCVSELELTALKGLASHIAEGANPWSEAAKDLACNWLRPPYAPGMMLVHMVTGDVGEVVSTGELSFTWKPYSAKEEICETDRRVVLPFTPHLANAGLYTNGVTARIQSKMIMDEFKAFYPFDNVPSPGTIPLSPIASHLSKLSALLPPPRS